jgi:rRNA maturation protein Rpf1
LVTFALDQGIKNIEMITNPLFQLRKRISREVIIFEQKLEFKEIIEECYKSENFEFIDQENNQYRLLSDLLQIAKNKEFKVLLPQTLIGPLLAFTHLLGHMGVEKMLKNSNNYYFDNMYSHCQKFYASCYGCFLNHGS